MPQVTKPKLEQEQDKFDKQALAVLLKIMREGDRGYKGSIDALDPVPTAENNWLYDVEKEQYQGRFLDGDKVFEFMVTWSNGKWTRSFKPISGVEDFTEDDPNEDGVLMEFGWLVKRVLKAEFEGVGIAIALEYLPGDVRFPGKRHSKKLKAAYGHIQGFRGGDKEALDCYVSRELLEREAAEPELGTVRSPLLIGSIYVVQQINPATGEDDEEKLMIGWEDIESAERAYLAEMPKAFLGAIEEIDGSELEEYRKEGAAAIGDEDERWDEEFYFEDHPAHDFGDLYGVWFKNRRTSIVVTADSRSSAISKARKKKKRGGDEVATCRKLNESERKAIRGGRWLRTGAKGEKAGYNPSFRGSGVPPGGYSEGGFEEQDTLSDEEWDAIASLADTPDTITEAMGAIEDSVNLTEEK